MIQNRKPLLRKSIQLGNQLKLGKFISFHFILFFEITIFTSSSNSRHSLTFTIRYLVSLPRVKVCPLIQFMPWRQLMTIA